MLGFIILILAVSASIAWLWAGGIDYMKQNHPEYKGKDFLEWGDNKVHTEGEI